MKLKDRVAIITGGGAGNGRAIALGFAREGADIVAADINLEAARRVADEVRELGRRALALKVDVTRKLEVHAMVRAAVDEFGRIDILVNNAGIRAFSSIVDMAEEEWDRHIAIDLKGPFLCTQAVAPVMMRQNKGKIINMSSGAAELPLRNQAHYCVAKAGLKMLTMVSAYEFAPYRINVNAIAPGIVEETGLFEDIRANPARVEQLLRTIPLGRFAHPGRDLVPLAVYLASDDSDYMTGHSAYLEGGLLLAM